MKNFYKHFGTFVENRFGYTLLLMSGLLLLNLYMNFSNYRTDIHYQVETLYDGKPVQITYVTYRSDWQWKSVWIKTKDESTVLGFQGYPLEKFFTIKKRNDTGEILERRSMNARELALYRQLTF